MPESTSAACTHSSRAGSLAAYGLPVSPSTPVTCSCTRRTRAAARSATARSPKVMVARYADVAASRPTGSARQSLCWSTPAIASGCSAWIMSARRPATGEERSPLMRHVMLAGPKKPSSAGCSGMPLTSAAADRPTRPAASAYSLMTSRYPAYPAVLTPVSAASGARGRPAHSSQVPARPARSGTGSGAGESCSSAA